MNKKIIYAILILIIIISAVLAVTIGFKLDTAYDENTKIYVYIGKQFNNEDLKQVITEVFETDKIEIQKVEVYEDMACITIPKQENASDKLETLNTKINEKFGIENKKDEIEISNQAKIDIYSIIKPYIIPLIITTVVILVYVAIMYRKLGVIKTICTYILTILAPEAAYVLALVLAKIPVNELTIPVAVVIYVISILSLTIVKQKQLQEYKLNEK